MQLYLEKVLDFLLPPACINCNCLIESYGNFCIKCWQSISFSSEPACKLCSQPFEYQTEYQFICGACNKNPPEFTKAIHLFAYDNNAKKMILDLKFYDKTQLAKLLAKHLHKKIQQQNWQIDYVIPVPLHKKKLQVRLFNQASLIASNIAKFSNLKFLPNFFTKEKEHPPSIWSKS